VKVSFVDSTVEDRADVIGRLEVFTTPISVFTREDTLWNSACYDPESQVIYALVSSPNLSLLYTIIL
jgi:hypothetical protein